MTPLADCARLAVHLRKPSMPKLTATLFAVPLPGDRSLLAPGAAVTVRALQGEDDRLTAVSVQAEKDGVKPLP